MGKDHLALVFGDFQSLSLNRTRIDDDEDKRLRRGATTQNHNKYTEHPVLVRIHSCCFTGETIGSDRCDCGEQLETALSLMGKQSSGVLLYLKQEGRNIGLKHKLL
jgi:GTP cyclohydrolase II